MANEESFDKFNSEDYSGNYSFSKSDIESYSPSIRYNYNKDSEYSSQPTSKPKSFSSAKPKWKIERNLLNTQKLHNKHLERVIRQNDIMINLLKEIRDRLPEENAEGQKAVDTDGLLLPDEMKA